MIYFYILIGIVVVIALIRIKNVPEELIERKIRPPLNMSKSRKKKSRQDSKQDYIGWSFGGGSFDGGGSDGGDGSSTGF